MQIVCGAPTKHQTFLERLLHFLLAILNFVHVRVGPRRFCEGAAAANSTALPGENNNTLRIATWPQYANITSNGHLRLESYAYAIPTCADAGSLASMVSFIIHNLTGGNPATLAHDNGLPPDVAERYGDVLRDSRTNRTLMPADYMSESVRGARIALTGHESDHATILDGETNNFGHFEAVGNVSLPSKEAITPFYLHLQGCDNHTTSTFATPVEIHTIAPTGLTIVSDVDDVLRVAEIWNWKRMFQNLFLRPYTPWSDMPALYEAWKKAAPNVHFHYYSDAPEMSHAFYVDGTRASYPDGTFGFRPMQMDTLSHLTNPRYNHIKRLIESFPQRRFILVGDTSTGSVLSAYGALAKDLPQQVQCILLRDVRATVGAADWIVPDLKALPDRSFNLHRLFASVEDIRWESQVLVERLASGGGEEGVGCGGLGADPSASETQYHGAFGSWVRTVRNGVVAYVRCALQMEFRPSPDCVFDSAPWYWEKKREEEI